MSEARRHRSPRCLARALTTCALYLLCDSTAAAVAAQVPTSVVTGAPAGPGQPTIYLLTIGPGDAVWEKFGHNAIWIRDPVRGTDQVYDWGRFDFNQPGFLPRFLKGRWIYSMGDADITQYLYAYQLYNRTVTAQELALSPAQAEEIRRFTEWHNRPENREYRYDYFRDNCSTRVRDVLDRGLGGSLRQQTGTVPTGLTYRWHSERLMRTDPLSYAGLLAGLGPASDQPISAWEEMFLPGKLQERIRAVQVATSGGRPIPLVRSELTLVQSTRPGEPATPPRDIPWALAGGLGFGILLVLLGRRAAGSRLARTTLAVLAGGWTLLAGIGGVLLVLLWTATDHEIAYRNENLFHLSPLALPLALLLPLLAVGSRRPRVRRLAAGFAALLVASSLVGALLQVIPGLDQENGALIAFVLPAHLGLLLATRRLARA